MSTYDAILPAGGEIEPEFASRVGTSNKALIRLGQATVLERIVRALRESGVVRRIALIGPAEVAQSVAAAEADLMLEPGTSGPDNILRGLEALASTTEPPDRVLVATTDLPFLTGELVAEFLASCPEAIDICLPVTTREQYLHRFPGSSATFVRLRDAAWTAGNMYLLNAQALRQAKPHIDRIFAARKSKLAMAQLLGPDFLFRYITRRLSVPDLEAKIQSLLKVSGRAIPDSAPELAYDIDSYDDYMYALRHLEGSH